MGLGKMLAAAAGAYLLVGTVLIFTKGGDDAPSSGAATAAVPGLPSVDVPSDFGAGSAAAAAGAAAAAAAMGANTDAVREMKRAASKARRNMGSASRKAKRDLRRVQREQRKALRKMRKLGASPAGAASVNDAMKALEALGK
jgi:hypothetical protein